MSARLPEWIREKRLNLQQLHEMKSLLRQNSLHSVCESLACPNRSECFSRGTATFMILGDVCTRACGFCNVTTGRPYAPPSADEPVAVLHLLDALKQSVAAARNSSAPQATETKGRKPRGRRATA